MYLDQLFQRAIAEGFEQIVVLGTGYDSRALRFDIDSAGCHVFEIDTHRLQKLKFDVLRKHGIRIPRHLVLVPAELD